jgi:hypothetical protein
VKPAEIGIARDWLCKQRPLLGNGRNRYAPKNRRAVGSGILFKSVRGSGAITEGH